MPDIDVGKCSSHDNNASFHGTKTFLVAANPSNGSGYLDTIELWCYPGYVPNSCKIGTFWESGDAGEYTMRAYVTLTGLVAYQNIKSVNLEIETDDLIGITIIDPSGSYYTYSEDTGGGWVASGDCMDGVEHAFGWQGLCIPSVYGTATIKNYPLVRPYSQILAH